MSILIKNIFNLIEETAAIRDAFVSQTLAGIPKLISKTSDRFNRLPTRVKTGLSRINPFKKETEFVKNLPTDLDRRYNTLQTVKSIKDIVTKKGTEKVPSALEVIATNDIPITRRTFLKAVLADSIRNPADAVKTVRNTGSLVKTGLNMIG
jgi:hypothetical protein